MLRSLWLWTAVSALIIGWLPFLTVVRLLDRDPARYRTGYYFRRLGYAITKVNPAWKVDITGYVPADPRRPYVVVSNHQSLADIPVLSCLPWEMKWIAKTELFRIPFVGWMMRLAGDIELERENPRSGAAALFKARDYLQKRCSVLVFPEGTRSRDGRVGAFSDGAFRLAIKEQLPILPVAVEGTQGALPKHSWQFGETSTIQIRVFEPIETAHLARTEAGALAADVRRMITEQIAEWRGDAASDVGRSTAE